MKIQIKKIVGVLLACAGIMTSTSCADFEEINKNLKKAQDCIMELRMGLDFKYPVAGEFEKVYDYIYRRLVEGNMTKDVEIIKDTLTHIHTMRDTWKEVVRLNNEGKA